MAQERTVVLVAFEGFQLLDLAGPTDAFRAASLLDRGPGYRTVVATPGGAAVRADSGVVVGADAALGDLAEGTEAVDTLMVVGGLGVRGLAADGAALDALRRLSARARRTTSVCTGALALAAAGLLDGHRATTHWASCDELATAHPGVTVEADRIYVQDRDRWTSAGVTAALDLTLALIEDDGGSELAQAVAGWLVVFVRRPGGQAQFSIQLQGQSARTPALVELQRWLPDHLDQDLSVEVLARRAAMSPRSFARAFRREVGTTPAALVEALRVEAARRLLETTDLKVAAVADRVGLGRPETLHRAFRRRVGTTPDQYRRHFHRRAS